MDPKAPPSRRDRLLAVAPYVVIAGLTAVFIVPIWTAVFPPMTDFGAQLIMADGSERTLTRWFDTAAFSTARGHYGNSGRNILTAPGLVNLDFAVFKNFVLTESKDIQLRFESYNFTNTPAFNPPTLEISSGNFGRVTSAGLGREMQIALRFQF